MRGIRPRSSIVAVRGHVAGAAMRVGAAAGFGGSMAVQALRQKGVNTWKGLPLRFCTSHGSISSAVLKLRASMPA